MCSGEGSGGDGDFQVPIEVWVSGFQSEVGGRDEAVCFCLVHGLCEGRASRSEVLDCAAVVLGLSPTEVQVCLCRLALPR
jgi:hypothetical protein